MNYVNNKSIQQFFEIADEKRSEYLNGKPFPHICIDNFFDEKILDQILSEFPNLKEEDEFYRNSNEFKYASRGEYKFEENTRKFMHFLNSQPMLEFLSKLTGIENLIPDPYFWGGGLHQIVKGGYLKIHADFNVHPTMKLDRRINLLVYLNKNWDDQFGGAFELWDEEMTHCQSKIFPYFNRLVVFSTTSTSYHGHPDPLNCPENISRKSLALYYYTNGRPEEERKLGLLEHTTLFRKRKTESDDKMDTLKVDQSIKRSKELHANEEIKTRNKFIKKFIPPILIDFKNYILNKE